MPATQGLKEVWKISLDYRHIHIINHSQGSLFPTESSPCFAKKFLTGRSGHAQVAAARFTKESLVTGAGTYHPATSTPSFVEPNGMDITNTINRAELAAVTAVILHGHSHIATDSLSSLHEIRKHLMHSELQRHHVQRDILKMLMQIICNSPNPVYLF